MAFIPSPNAAKALVLFSHGFETFSNQFYFTKDAFSTADMEALAAAIDLSVGDVHMPNISSGVQYINTTVYDARSIGGEIVLDNTSNTVGGAEGDPLSSALAVVVTLRTATRGRSGRGRVYMGGLTEGEMLNGIFTATGISVATGYVANIEAAAAAIGWTYVLRSTQQDGNVLNPAVMRPITGWEVRAGLPGLQRRRVDRP